MVRLHSVLAGTAILLGTVVMMQEAAGQGMNYACNKLNGQQCCPSDWKWCQGKGLPTCPGGNYMKMSSLYGCDGEKWDSSRLPIDWSFAGYKAGDAGLPWVTQTVNIRDFGAKGDGSSDDSEAFKRAIAATKDGTALFIPGGKYVITQRVDIRKAIVIRGAGKGQTTLYYPKALSDVYGNRRNGDGSTEWAHGTCFINFWGWDPIRGAGQWGGTYLAKVNSYIKKGSRTVQVNDVSKIKKGQWVRVTASDPGSGELVKGLLSNSMEPGWRINGNRNLIRFTSRVQEVGPGNQIKLERQIPFDVSTNWMPEVHAFNPRWKNAGVEDLTIEFKWERYPGHLQERGFNAIHFNQMSDSWVKNVRILNADAGIYFWGATFSTVTDVDIGTTKYRGDGSYDEWDGKDKEGHRGVWTERGADNLFTKIRMQSSYMHDFSVATTEIGSVWSYCSGPDLNLDFHKGAPYANLYTNLDMGLGTRPFRSGGGAGAGPNAGSFQTFWNLKSKQPLTLPNSDFGPYMNFIGLYTRDPSAARMRRESWLQDPSFSVFPDNLWAAMKKKRVGWV